MSPREGGVVLREREEGVAVAECGGVACGLAVAGGVGQLGFALAQGYWLYQMAYDRRTFTLSTVVLFTQQLGCAAAGLNPLINLPRPPSYRLASRA